MRLPHAPLEKVYAAEHGVAGVRLAIIVLNVAVYAFLLQGTGLPWLAWTVAAVALPYGAAVFAFQPYRRFPVLLSSYFTSLTDAALITLWLAATGGAASPFFVLWYVSLAAIAFRFDARETVVAALVYAACYVGLVAALGQLPAASTDVLVRTAYVFFVGAVGALLARHSTAQTRAKGSLQRLAEASNRIAAQLDLDRVLGSVLEASKGLVGADRAAVYLLDPRSGQPACARSDGLSEEDLEAGLRLCRELPGRDVLDGKAPHLHVADALEGFRSYAVLPLRLHGEALGLLSLYRDEVRPFTEEELSLATSLANHAAVAIANARLVGELRGAVSLASATLESTADGLLVVDREGRMVSFNRKFVDMWGLPPEVAASGDDRAAIASVLGQLKDPEAFLAKVRELYAAPEATSFDLLEFKDGRVFERYSMPQRVGDAVAGRVWSFRDVSAQRRAERERLDNLGRLKELERLRELDAFKTQFMNMAAHELGTPLTPLKTSVFLLKAGKFGPLAPDQQRAVELLGRNLDRLQNLVRDMLESARIQAGQLGLAKQEVDLNRLVLEAVETFEEAARAQGVTLESRLAPNLVAAADAKRLTQVLFNLLSNAVKFTPPGGTVTLETRRSEAWATVRVTDTGRGLRPEDIPKLFQPFIQVHDRMETTGPGTGLGLYISRAIVELHGGEVWAHSRGLGQGAAFGFTIPLRDAPRAAGAGVAAEGQRKKLTP